MRTGTSIAILAVLCCLCSSASTAQQVRPLTVWVDTLRMNVCGDKTFQTAVWAGSPGASDTVVGFRRQDSVSSVTLYIMWDLAQLDLDDFVLTNGALGQQTKVTARSFPNEGILEVLMADAENPLRILSGQQPLFYLSGRVKAPDTVSGLNGWILPTDIELTSTTRYEPETYRAGFVRVVRDTTAAYTATLTTSSSSLDTLRSDTITVSIENVRSRRVTEISLALAVDRRYVQFVDTLQGGTLAERALWSAKEVQITPDSVTIRLVADRPIDEQGALISIILGRVSDSAFTTPITVSRFAVNEASCLGKLVSISGTATAARIPSDTAVAVTRGHDAEAGAVTITVLQAEHAIVLSGITGGTKRVDIYDVRGEKMASAAIEHHSSGSIRIPTTTPLQSGIYFAVLSGRTRRVKQFNYIQ